jgi:acyl-CoA synthetase (AMP-forming)/AMP-acid ligase II
MFGLVTLVHLCPHLGIASVVFKSMPSFNIFLETIVRLRIGHLFLAPPLVNAFVKHPATLSFDLRFFRSAMIAAAPLDSEMESAFQKIGGPEFLVTQGFGMTECGGLITGLPFGTPPRPGSVGRLLSSTEAKIVDEHGVVLVAGQRGHLCVRGPQLCLGYLGNAQATQAAFDTDGFLLTGDIADMTADGYFHIVDRLKYMIKTKASSSTV